MTSMTSSTASRHGLVFVADLDRRLRVVPDRRCSGWADHRQEWTDDPLAALVAGAIIGLGQWLASWCRLRPVRWILATVLGMALVCCSALPLSGLAPHLQTWP